MDTSFDLAELRFCLEPAERERRRVAAREATRKANLHRPLTGAWYWVPFPGASDTLIWHVQEYFDDWQPNSDHIYVWKHVLDSMRLAWKRPLKGIEYCSLPRGRVSKMLLGRKSAAVFAMYHGGDSPVGKRGFAKVRRVFQLPVDTAVIFDEHERCIAGQPEALSRALGRDLKVRGVAASELDWDDT